MATVDSPKATWSDTTTHRRAITDLISIIDPSDTPIIAYFGWSKASKAGWNMVNWPSIQAEWLEDSLHPRADSLDGSITSVATTITMHDKGFAHEGDVLLVDSEKMWVSAHSTSGEVLTVVRSIGGTTNASHADDATVTVIGNARLEGDDADMSNFTDVTAGTNYTQIIEEAIKVTETQQAITQYGIEDEYERQMMKKAKEALIKLELSIIHGARVGPGTSTVARQMGGLNYFLNSAGGNTVDFGAAITQANFDAAMQAAYEDGGKPRVAFCSPTNMLAIRNIYDSSTYLRIERDENTIGMTIDKIHTPFGDADLVMSRLMPDTIVPIVDPDHFMLLALREFGEKKLGEAGDYTRGEIVGEFTACIRHPLEAHACLYT